MVEPRLRRRRALAATIAAAFALAGCAGAEAAPTEVHASLERTSPDGSEIVGQWPTTTTTTTVVLENLDPATGLGISGPFGPPWPKEFTAAYAKVPAVALYQSPGVPVPTGRSQPNPTVEGVQLVMLVRAQLDDWLMVQINSRPNGATAWIKRSDVDLHTVPNHILIELGAKRLTVFHGDEAIFTTSVAPGKASSPTPTGSFYVDVLAKPTNPNGPYGAYQVSFTGFSNVYSSFGGGVGQVAMHGTNRPELIGTPASAGCVRLTNEDVTTVLGLAPPGTPVDVVA